MLIRPTPRTNGSSRIDGARTVYGGLILGIACLAAAFAPSVAAAAEVNIYSYRKEQLIRPQLEAFKTATGIQFKH